MIPFAAVFRALRTAGERVRAQDARSPGGSAVASRSLSPDLPPAHRHQLVRRSSLTLPLRKNAEPAARPRRGSVRHRVLLWRQLALPASCVRGPDSVEPRFQHRLSQLGPSPRVRHHRRADNAGVAEGRTPDGTPHSAPGRRLVVRSARGGEIEPCRGNLVVFSLLWPGRRPRIDDHSSGGFIDDGTGVGAPRVRHVDRTTVKDPWRSGAVADRLSAARTPASR